MKKNKKYSGNKILLRSALAMALALLALAAYVDVQSSSVVPVLMYHSFSPSEDGRYTSVGIDPRIFEDQVKFFSRNRYNIVGPDKVVEYMTGKEKMPPKTVSITVDDGYADFYEVAYPVLKRYNMPATIFVTPDRVGRHSYLNWEQLRELSGSGLITIGSHTMTHTWLPTVSVDEEKLREELAGSKKEIERQIGKSVDYLCYPNGGFNDLVKDAAREYGYKGAFTTNPSGRGGLGDIYAIRRLKMSSSSDNHLIVWGKANRFYAWFKERR
jgi:peptidoglycan/xylan/chitin deacetylase (PgdA/CDA1 family)